MWATAIIQADLMVCQAASATPVVSTALVSTGTGGLRLSPVPTLGGVVCPAATTMSTDGTPFGTTAFLLVASGIKNFKL